MSRMSWTSDEDHVLRRLWADGLSAKNIADKLGCTKNAIIGRAHRLQLPQRPSPIKARDGQPIVTRTKIVADKPVKVMETQHTREPVAKRPVPPPRPAVPRLAPAPLLPRLERLPLKAPTPNKFSGPTCHFPMWGNKQRPTHVYCDAPRLEGKAYCLQHAARCFEPGRHRRDRAA